MKMFERLAEKEVIHICVGTTFRPNELYKRVLNFRRRTELEKKQGEIEGDAQVFEPGPSKIKGKKAKKTPKRQPKTIAKSTNVTLPAPITPRTAFKSLPVGKNPRFFPIQTNAATARPTVVTEHRLLNKKFQRQQQEGRDLVPLRVESSKKRKSVKRKVSFDDFDEQASDGDTSDHDLDRVETSSDDEQDDDSYFQRLYKNGEMYDAKEFGKIQLRPWMLFMDKAHLKSVVRDYCIQEGFAIVVDAAHNIRKVLEGHVETREEKRGKITKGRGPRLSNAKSVNVIDTMPEPARGGLIEKQKKEMQTSGKPLLIQNPRVRDQSYAAKAAKASKDTATQASQTNTTHCTPS
ncbi:hypothetical protein ACET3Z_028268 [Daucus carota]